MMVFFILLLLYNTTAAANNGSKLKFSGKHLRLDSDSYPRDSGLGPDTRPRDRRLTGAEQNKSDVYEKRFFWMLA